MAAPLDLPTVERTLLGLIGEPAEALVSSHAAALRVFREGGLGGETSLATVERWNRNTFLPLCRASGADGEQVLAVLVAPHAEAPALARVWLFLRRHTSFGQLADGDAVAAGILLIRWAVQKALPEQTDLAQRGDPVPAPGAATLTSRLARQDGIVVARVIVWRSDSPAAGGDEALSGVLPALTNLFGPDCRRVVPSEPGATGGCSVTFSSEGVGWLRTCATVGPRVWAVEATEDLVALPVGEAVRRLSECLLACHAGLCAVDQPAVWRTVEAGVASPPSFAEFASAVLEVSLMFRDFDPLAVLRRQVRTCMQRLDRTTV